MISIITTGRDDDYGEGFLDRLHKSVEANSKYLKSKNIPYEYLICEWNPIRDYLCNNSKFKGLFEDYNLKSVAVLNSVAQKENLNQEIFYEYFAKNAGIRNSKYDTLLLLNSDIIIPEKSFDEILHIVNKGLDKNKFYRLEYRNQVDNDLNLIKRETIYYPENPDAVICGYCSGDFLLINKNTLVDHGEGYDETNAQHRTISQTAMDGEILWNLHNKGICIELISHPYLHINHGRTHQRDGFYNMNGYKNKPNWGFIDYKKEIISDRLIIIK